MQTRGGPSRWRRIAWIGGGALTLAVSLMVVTSFMSREPDWPSLSTRELVELSSDHSFDTIFALRGELLARDESVIVPELIALTRADVDSTAAKAVNVLGVFLEHPGEFEEQIERALLDLLTGGTTDLTAAAVLALGSHWRERPPGVLPECALRTIENLLGSKDAGHRAASAVAGMWCGHLISSLAPAFVDALTREQEAGTRMLLCSTLGNIGADPQAATAALVPRLEDDDSRVQTFAAASLATLGAPTPTSLRALGKLLRNDQASRDARLQAACALGGLVADSKDAEAVLPSAIGIGAHIDEFERCTWIDAVGQLTAMANPESEAGQQGRRLLEAEQLRPDDVQIVATCGLARIAMATRNLALTRDCLVHLQALVSSIHDAAVKDRWGAVSSYSGPVVEVLVQLSHWEELGWDPALLRSALEQVRKTSYRYERDWAAEQLELLGR